jgi:hypothetical protein
MTLSGDTLRGYEIGSGDDGEVYHTTQLSVKRDVAIKAILPQYANCPMFVLDFEADVRFQPDLAEVPLGILDALVATDHAPNLIGREA